MARLLQANRVNKRWSNVVRTWLALRQQRRRRGGLGTPAQPAILSHVLEESAGEPLYWFDVVLTFAFEQGRFPDGTIEVFWARESTGWVENSLGAVSSTVRTFRQVRAFSDFEGDIVSYRMRYRYGTEIVGPMSEAYPLVYVAP